MPVYKLANLTVLFLACVNLHADESSANFDVEAFDKINFDGTATLQIVQGDQYSVEATGSQALIDSLEVEVSDGVLHLDINNKSAGVEDIYLYITVNSLTEVSSQGSGKILMDDIAVENLHLRGIGSGQFLLSSLNAHELSVESRGASRFEISGTAERQVVELGGAGKYLAQNLITRVGSISIFGAGIGELWVDEWLDVRIAGAGQISYAGAAQVAQNIFGFGSVQRLDKL